VSIIIIIIINNRSNCEVMDCYSSEHQLRRQNNKKFYTLYHQFNSLLYMVIKSIYTVSQKLANFYVLLCSSKFMNEF